MSGSVSAASGELINARAAIMLPCNISSWSVDSEARTGGETQAGGPRWSEYSADIMCDELETGESDLRDRVSGITFFFPLTCLTVN